MAQSLLDFQDSHSPTPKLSRLYGSGGQSRPCEVDFPLGTQPPAPAGLRRGLGRAPRVSPAGLDVAQGPTFQQPPPGGSAASVPQGHSETSLFKRGFGMTWTALSPHTAEPAGAACEPGSPVTAMHSCARGCQLSPGGGARAAPSALGGPLSSPSPRRDPWSGLGLRRTRGTNSPSKHLPPPGDSPRRATQPSGRATPHLRAENWDRERRMAPSPAVVGPLVGTC